MRRSPFRYVLLGGCLLALVLLLLIEGFTTHTVGASSTRASDGSGQPLLGQNPILSYRAGGLYSRQPPPGKRIALTFDDGPNPRWTPKIAAILRAEHVPATFFEVGALVVRYPEVTRMLYRDGFEIGGHTFTHADLAELSAWERSAQISATETAIAGAIGVRPTLVRPPYSSTPSAATRRQVSAWGSIARSGYTIVLANYDTEDWTRPGVARILSNGTPPRGQGGIIMLHDAGGNREQTVRALPLLIDRLRARGYQFVRVLELAGMPMSAADSPASSGQKFWGRSFDLVLAVAGGLTSWLTRLVELVTFLVGLRMAIGLALAYVHVRRIRRLPTDPGYAPSVSIVVPAYNEALGIAKNVQSLAGSTYRGELELIVVDDGSSDGTAAAVRSLELDTVRVVEQPNTGKAAALNRGIRLSHGEVIVTVDADTVFEEQTLARLVQRLRDPAVGAVSGNTKVGNRRSLIGRWQHIEYVMGFNLDRRAYELVGATPTVPGAIGAFRRQALADIGGISGATLAEDTDITLDIARAGWNVVYEQRARAWTEAPSTLRALYRQRERWAYGTIQSAWKHRRALWGPGEHRRARQAVAVLALFQMALPLTAPLVDLFALYSIVFLDPMPILLFWGLFNGFQAVLAWFAFGFDRESRRPLWALPLQQFLWRQIMYLVVLDGIISAAIGSRQGWRHSSRTGSAAIGGQGTPVRAPVRRAARALAGTPVRAPVRRAARALAVGWRPARPARVAAALAAAAAVGLWSGVALTGERHFARAAAPSVNGPSSSNPFAGQLFSVNHDSNAYWQVQTWKGQHRYREARLMAKIAGTPRATWFADSSNGHGSTYADARLQVKQDLAQHAMAVLVAYDIPWRDCGGYSSGGARSPAAYARFIDQLARGIGSVRAAVILEPDALAELDCLSRARQNAYYALLSRAVDRLTQNPQTAVYLDAGNNGWVSAAPIAKRLARAGVARARGFALNVSNFDSTASEARYGHDIVKLLGGGHFIIDTSRNGRGAAPGDAWCNPPGRGLGVRPTAQTGDPELDAFYWIKAPGESDGRCGMPGAPPSGDWWPRYALMLARNAVF
jgi:cellulose synthase/poly-beta-1,6-N-acetylglucosamine synthase-like glycosyltransferase/peptidoglycan/xylan/chitin deacetylase (PgdA/CDA1 family)